MENDKLRNQIEENRQTHINNIMDVLRQDPDEEEQVINDSDIREYLVELIERNDSLISGLILACETYLDK